jgi:hypothetical protein
MWENRDGGKRRAAIHPAEEYPHLELADVKFKIPRKAPVALFGRKREDFQIDPFRFDGAVNEKPGAVVFVARKGQAEICHIMKCFVFFGSSIVNLFRRPFSLFCKHGVPWPTHSALIVHRG